MKINKKMLIQLDKDFRLVNDPNNLVLEKRYEVENKETKEVTEKWANDGYYTSVNGLLKGYKRKSIIKSSAQSLEELAEDVKRIGNRIDEFIGGDYY